jgi:glycine betaine/proline transport system permease protein
LIYPVGQRIRLLLLEGHGNDLVPGFRLQSFFTEFPEMPNAAFREMKKGIDAGYKDFAREWGDTIDAIFDPLLSMLVFFEDLLIATPWPIFMVVLLALTYWGSRSIKLVIMTFLAFVFIGYFKMWEETMSTIAIILTSVIMAVAIGLPTGIAMSRSDRTQSIVTPILDIMQTMPPFVYLIPIVMLMGIGKIPGLIAVVIYAIPPLIRLTNLGIREVDQEALEAADAFGATKRQKLFQVQLPLALPTIFAGINQTIMMALAMVIIASMIGVKGLGQPVLQSIYNQYFTKGVLYGLAIVIVAIVFDRVSQSYGQRIQKHRSGRLV